MEHTGHSQGDSRTFTYETGDLDLTNDPGASGDAAAATAPALRATKSRLINSVLLPFLLLLFIARKQNVRQKVSQSV